MRKWTICALAVLALLGSVMTASAQELTEALPPEAQELLDGLEEENAADGGFGAGLARLWEKGCESFLDILRQSLRGVVLLLGAVLVCGVAEDCLQAAGSEVNYVSMAGALVVTALTAGSVRGLMTLGMETIEQLDVFSKALLPTLAAAVAASGGSVSAGGDGVFCRAAHHTHPKRLHAAGLCLRRGRGGGGDAAGARAGADRQGRF